MSRQGKLRSAGVIAICWCSAREGGSGSPRRHRLGGSMAQHALKRRGVDSANGPRFVVCDPYSAGCSRQVARVASRADDVLGGCRCPARFLTRCRRPSKRPICRSTGTTATRLGDRPEDAGVRVYVCGHRRAGTGLCGHLVLCGCACLADLWGRRVGFSRCGAAQPALTARGNAFGAGAINSPSSALSLYWSSPGDWGESSLAPLDQIRTQS